MKRLFLLLGCGLILSGVVMAQPQLKFGPLTESQTWSGDIYLVEDVTIPTGTILTIAKGSQLYFKAPSKFIVYGKIVMESDPLQPVKMFQLNQGTYELLSDTSSTQVIRFQPYQVDTQGLQKEFRHFKWQYLALWSAVYLLAYTQVAW